VHVHSTSFQTAGPRYIYGHIPEMKAGLGSGARCKAFFSKHVTSYQFLREGKVVNGAVAINASVRHPHVHMQPSEMLPSQHQGTISLELLPILAVCDY
jgi:hypothetical protein